MFYAVDMGGSIFVHTFGAVFGLMVAWVYRPHRAATHKLCGSSYQSNLVAMVGTLFLWMYWPSFNGALASGNSQHRVVINTVLALCCSCFSTFITSSLTHKGKFEMEDVLNATLAGGVIIGSSSDLVVNAYLSMIIGLLGGVISSLGFRFLSPFANKYLKLHDTCGVLNLHGIPGILGGLIGALTAGVTTDKVWGEDISEIFPKRGTGGSRENWEQGLF